MDRIGRKGRRRHKPVGSGRTASRFDLVLDTVGRLLRRGAIGNLERMVSKMHPADVAKMLHHLNTAQEKRTVFELIKPDTSKATALSEMDEGDRKSTRLNSSHGYISYAVFCLKKKKKKNSLHH